MGRDSEALRDLDHMLRAIPGARAETRAILEVFKREMAWLIDAHRARSLAAAVLIRHAGFTFGQQDPSDAAKGADPAKQDAEGFTGLHSAAFFGHLETVEALLDRANVRAVLEVRNVYGGTVLDGTVWGARNVKRHVDRLPVIRKLIEAGARIEGVGPRPVDIPAIEALLVASSAAR